MVTTYYCAACGRQLLAEHVRPGVAHIYPCARCLDARTQLIMSRIGVTKNDRNKK